MQRTLKAPATVSSKILPGEQVVLINWDSVDAIELGVEAAKTADVPIFLSTSVGSFEGETSETLKLYSRGLAKLFAKPWHEHERVRFRDLLKA